MKKMRYPARIEKMRQRILDDIVTTLEYLQVLRADRIPAQNIINREEAKKRLLVRRLHQLENGIY